MNYGKRDSLHVAARSDLQLSEWARSPMRERYSSSRYMQWHHKCEVVAQRYGFAVWTVLSACLISGYQPDKAGFVLESDWPKIRIITESTDAQFIARLAYEAQLRGLYVIARQGSVETTQLFFHAIPLKSKKPPPLPLSLPPRDNAFYIRVETPVGYPPQAAKQLHGTASQLGKEILKALGYSVPERLRLSRLVAMADKLRIAKNQLVPNEAYDIIDEIYGSFGPMGDDQGKRKLVASRRHKLRKRIIKPYIVNDENRSP